MNTSGGGSGGHDSGQLEGSVHSQHLAVEMGGMEGRKRRRKAVAWFGSDVSFLKQVKALQAEKRAFLLLCTHGAQAGLCGSLGVLGI